MNKSTTQLNHSSYSAWRLGRPWRPSNTATCRRSLLQVLALAHQTRNSSESLPLITLLKLYAQEETWGYRNLVVRLIQRLESGLSLADAIEQTPELLSDEEVLAIRLSSQSGMLPEALDQMHKAYGEPNAAIDGNETSWLYYISLGFFFCLVITLIRVLILPTFAEIFEEFALKTSVSFRWLQSPWADALIVLAPMLLVGLVLCSWLSKKMGFTRRIRRAVGSFLSSRQHRLSQAKALLLLSGAMQGGRPSVGVLATLARFHFDSRVRNQLLFARNEIELGSEMPESLNQAGLISATEASALQRLEKHANRGWLLSKIAHRSIAQVVHERRLLATLIHPLVIGLFGLVTLLVCMAVMSMLIKMIVSLS